MTRAKTSSSIHLIQGRGFEMKSNMKCGESVLVQDPYSQHALWGAVLQQTLNSDHWVEPARKGRISLWGSVEQQGRKGAKHFSLYVFQQQML